MKRFALSLVVLLACLSVLPLATGAANDTVSVSGTATVANGTANGDTVTVTPLDENYRRAGPSVNTTVSDGSFTADNVTKAPLYYVRLQHGGFSHYVLTNTTSGVAFELGASISGRVVTENGSAVPNARLLVTSPTGPPVGQVNTSENGTFDVGPLKPNTTYTIRMHRAGVPYRKTITTGNASDVRFVQREPTANDSVLSVSGGNPASRVMQVAPRNNSSGLRVVETLTLNNTGDRPFVGPVHVTLPDGATPTGAMFRDKQTQFTRRGDGVVVNATVAANDTTRIGVAYRIDNRTIQKTVEHDTDNVAVVLRGYNASQVRHSSNLRRGQSPIPMLTNGEPLDAGDRIRVHVPKDAKKSPGTSANQPAQDGGGSDFPVSVLALSFLSIVIGGILAYRAL
ncbi:carboxypeptidase-like regulatory domain-containing protein [Halomicrococcus sp. NG-SE-24]|uniref:carboxypeptidase-like regulatory domain-containing protein n=1 Tax=Halomicrococcus sp. NG-SE-24 TaxID=3436928 RepID=UPI003D971F01